MPLVSVLTASYDRADTLPRLYDSLRTQTFADFEWIVVDDGSRDDTEARIAGWAQSSQFAVRYEWQVNQGRHAALNRCVQLAAGRYCAIIDSDDWYLPNALERMVATWESIPAGRRAAFANVEGLCERPDGSLVGPQFPSDVFDSDVFEIVEVHGCTGDTKGMYRRDVLAEFPAPTDLGYVTAALVWNRIAARYQTRFVNEVWARNGYEPGGMTDHEHDLVLGAPLAWRTFWSEYASMPRRVPVGKRMRAHANYVRHSLNGRVGVRALLRDAPSKPWLAVTFPLGVALALRDRPRRGRG